ncbi:MAG: sterol desaturase family protein [Erythrobacter sp.]|nr:sterol desaturase family protein [Erythrobacter sp.]
MASLAGMDGEGLARMLSAQALLIYCGLIVLFAAIELLAARPSGTAAAAKGSKRNLVNFALWLFGMALLAALPLGLLAAAGLAADRGWGLFNRWAAPWPLVLLVALAGQTLVLYWLHRLSHAFAPLWRIHRVHHADPALDLSTGLRHHPAEVLITAPFHYGVVIALGLPAWAALLAGFLLFAGTLFKHLDASLPPRLERALGLVIATPALHRYHHSAHQPETDSNFGNFLIVWDRLFGTFHPASPAGPERLGLGDAHDRVADRLGWQLGLPMRDPPENSP